MKKILVFSLSFLVFNVSLWAQADPAAKGEVFRPLITAVPSLGITPDARAGGMGDVGAATDNDLNAQYSNPAKYVLNESSGGVSFSYTPWMAKLVRDINLLYLSGYGKIGENYAISGSMRYFSLGEIDLMDQGGEPMGVTSPYELSIDAAVSLKLADYWSAGVAVRYIRQDFGAVDYLFPGNAVGADVAVYYRLPFDVRSSYKEKGTFAAGLNISNIGSKISFTAGESNLFIPTNLRLGASFSYPFDDYNRIAINVDMNKTLVPHTPFLPDYDGDDDDGTHPETGTPEEEQYQLDLENYNNMSGIGGIFKAGFDFKDINWSFGAEYSYNKQFFVRGGYHHEHRTRGNRRFFTVGAGFRLRMFQLDAAYLISAAQTNPLDQTLRFTLSFDAIGLKDLVR